MEKHLGECLDSIFCQTLKNVEVICVNDGSTDASLDILDKYKKYESLVVLTQKNAGSGNARNVGIRYAKGDYLMFVDPDDCLAANDVVETLYTAAVKNKVQVCGGSIVKNKDGKLVKEFPDKRKENKVEIEGKVSFRQYQYPYGHQRYIIKHDLLTENNIFYPEYRRGQDVPFMASVLSAAGVLYLVKKDVYMCIGSPEEKSFTEQKADDYVNALCDTMKLAIYNGFEKLFGSMVRDIIIFAHKHWYRLLDGHDTWYKADIINEVIAKGNDRFHNEENIKYLFDKEEYGKYYKELRRQWENMKKFLEENKEIMLYGAGAIGKQVHRFLKRLGYTPKGFVVSVLEGNEKVIEGLSVISLDMLSNGKGCVFILCASEDGIKEDMKRRLADKGYDKVLPFNYDMITLLKCW